MLGILIGSEIQIKKLSYRVTAYVLYCSEGEYWAEWQLTNSMKQVFWLAQDSSGLTLYEEMTEKPTIDIYEAKVANVVKVNGADVWPIANYKATVIETRGDARLRENDVEEVAELVNDSGRFSVVAHQHELKLYKSELLTNKDVKI